MRTTDQTGETIELQGIPGRVVSLVPSQTELLFDLGLDREVVGVTRFCVHPEPWRRTKPRVGGTKDADAGRIRALDPDLVIANREENRRETVSDIRSFCPVWTSDVSDVPGAVDMIVSLGALLGREAEAGDIVRGLEPLMEMREGASNIRAAYLIWKDPWMAAGGDTFIHDMMRCAGLSNVFGGRQRYPTVTLADLESAGADLILLSSEPYPFRERHLSELAQLVPSAKPMLVDGEMFSWYGSRMLKAIPYLAGLRQILSRSSSGRLY